MFRLHRQAAASGLQQSLIYYQYWYGKHGYGMANMDWYG